MVASPPSTPVWGLTHSNWFKQIVIRFKQCMNGFQRIQNRLKKYKHSSLLVFKSPRFHNQSSQNTTFQTKGFPYSVIVRPLKENLIEALLRPFWGLLRPFLFWQNQKMIYKFKCLVVIFMFTIIVYSVFTNSEAFKGKPQWGPFWGPATFK